MYQNNGSNKCVNCLFGTNITYSVVEFNRCILDSEDLLIITMTFEKIYVKISYWMSVCTKLVSFYTP